MRLHFFHFILLVLVFLSSCSTSNQSVNPKHSKSSDTCYLTVTAKGEYDQFSVSSFSISLISRFHRRVLEPPIDGLSEKEECVYEVSVDSRDFTTVVSISGKDLNTSGDSKQSGMDGLQESILRALLNGLPNKKDQICERYGDKLVECGVDSKKLQEKLKVVQEDEMRKLQEEIRLLEMDVKKIEADRLRMETEVKSEIQRRKDEETKKREEELRIIREKEDKRIQEELRRKREELRKKQEAEERRRRVEELRIMKEKLEREKEEKEKRRLEEERAKREFEKKGYVPYDIRLRYLSGSVSSGETKVGSSTFQVVSKEYGIGMNQMTYKTKSSANNDYSMSNSTMDLSYTYGEDWTITGGIGFVTGGSGEITLSSSGLKYKSSGVSGNSLFGLGGFEWESYEGLIGIRYDKLKFKGFQSGTSYQSDSLSEDFSIGGLLFLIGIGLSF